MSPFANGINEFRVFPRLFALMYMGITVEVVVWAMNQPDLTNAQSALVTAVTVPAAAFFKFYVESGNRPLATRIKD